MRFKFWVLIIISLCFVNIGSNYPNINNNFMELEKKVSDNSTFIENAIQLRYSTNNSLESESQSIKDNLEQYNLVILKETNNIINLGIDNTSLKGDLVIWRENHKTNVQITIINYDSKIKLIDLGKIIYKKLSRNIQYYYLYKGKIERPILQEILPVDKKDVNLIKIENGETAVFNLKNGEKINVAQMKYNSGEYIIIATPIIFTTY